MKPPVDFLRKKLDNAIEIMLCTLRLSIDISLKVFVTHL